MTMRNNQVFTMNVISKIDEDIVNENLNKRFALWFNRAERKSMRRIPILATAAAFILIITSIFLFLPDDTPAPVVPSGKQVPIYQGMTVSNEAPAVQLASITNTSRFSDVSVSYPLFGAIGARLKPNHKPNKDTPEITSGPYYA